MFRKRGISPLIASVLLIAFVILLFVVISVWVRRTSIEPTIESSEEKIASQLEAMNTNVEIMEAELSGNSVKLVLSNIGSTEIENFTLRVIGDDGADLRKVSLDNNLKELDVVTKYIGFDRSKTGNVEKIEIIPIVSSGMAVSATRTKRNFVEDESLVGYWGFEGDADDLSGHENNGIVYGANCNVDGKFGKACSFDGSDDYIDVGSATSLDLGQTFSVSAWTRANTLKYYAGIVSKVISDMSSSYSYMLVCHNDGTIGAYDGNGWYFSENAGISAGEWYHVVWVITGGNIYYYVKGEPYGSDSFLYTDNTAHHVFFGSWAIDKHYDGIIDEIKIYNRALTEEEIKADAMIS